jgi:hypothetical protein
MFLPPAVMLREAAEAVTLWFIALLSRTFWEGSCTAAGGVSGSTVVCWLAGTHARSAIFTESASISTEIPFPVIFRNLPIFLSFKPDGLTKINLYNPVKLMITDIYAGVN